MDQIIINQYLEQPIISADELLEFKFSLTDDLAGDFTITNKQTQKVNKGEFDIFFDGDTYYINLNSIDFGIFMEGIESTYLQLPLEDLGYFMSHKFYDMSIIDKFHV